jgi:hypothetical protein
MTRVISYKIKITGEDIYECPYTEEYYITPKQWDAAWESVEEFRRGSNTHYLTSELEEVIGRVTGYGSVNLPGWEVKRHLKFS